MMKRILVKVSKLFQVNTTFSQDKLIPRKEELIAKKVKESRKQLTLSSTLQLRRAEVADEGTCCGVQVEREGAKEGRRRSPCAFAIAAKFIL